MRAKASRSEDRKMTNIGFIGLGIMGFPMAKRLIEAGYNVTVYNRTSDKAKPLVEIGAKPAATPRECAKGNEIVISMVTNSPDVEAVLLGPDGAVHEAVANALFIDMSTIAPEAARNIGRELNAKGIAFLDAPVTGGDIGARQGALSILVGGDAACLERARYGVFNILGTKITHCGPQGSGQIVKACNQILCAVNMVAICEALHLARLVGIDASLVIKALAGGAGSSWALENLGPKIAAGDFRPGFTVNLLLKDLEIAEKIASDLGLRLDGASIALELLENNFFCDEEGLGTQAMYMAMNRCIVNQET